MVPIKPEKLHAFNFKFKANFEPRYLKKLKKMENNAPDKDKIKYQNTIKHIKKRVLILCTGNSCRSQMAEGISKHFFSDSHDIFSAGTQPSCVHPIAIAVMKEIGIDISTYRSKSVDEFKEELFDFVITVCGKADQNCPIFQGPSTRIHWSFNDPAHATGNEETIKNEFRKVRDAIFKKFKTDWMKTLSLNAFWQCCNEIYSGWLFHRTLFDDNDQKQLLETNIEFFNQLNIMTWTFVRLEMAKLFDKHVWRNGSSTLCLEYMINAFEWEEKTKKSLNKQYNKLKQLKKPLHDLRHKKLAHNELNVEDGTGKFRKNKDIVFFKNLQKFLKIMYMATTGETCADFANHTKTDVLEFLNNLQQGQEALSTQRSTP